MLQLMLGWGPFLTFGAGWIPCLKWCVILGVHSGIKLPRSVCRHKGLDFGATKLCNLCSGLSVCLSLGVLYLPCTSKWSHNLNCFSASVCVPTALGLKQTVCHTLDVNGFWFILILQEDLPQRMLLTFIKLTHILQRVSLGSSLGSIEIALFCKGCALECHWIMLNLHRFCKDNLLFFMNCCLEIMTRTEGISVRVIRMLSQLVGIVSVERLNVKFTKKCMLLTKISM